jgi:hypothetical protein
MAPSPESSKGSARVARFVRWGVLLAIWGSMTYTTIAHQRVGGGPQGVPPVDALCPFGGMATLYKLAAGGGYIQRTFSSSVILLVGVVVTALVVRRAFCGRSRPRAELMGSLRRLPRVAYFAAEMAASLMT